MGTFGNAFGNNIMGGVNWDYYWNQRRTTSTYTISITEATDIRSANPTTNYGSLPSANIGEYFTDTNILRTLLLFDISSVPKRSIKSIKMRFYVSAEYAINDSTIQVYNLKRSWGKTTATWNTYDGVNNWSTSGAFGIEDCEQISLGSLSISSTESVGWKEITLNISSLSQIRYGFLLKTQNENNDSILITTSGNNRPQLVIEVDKIPLFNKYFNNPLFDGYYGSVVYDNGNLVFYYTNYLNIYKRTSVDGLTWSNPTLVMTPLSGGTLQVTTAWKEGNTWYMLYRSNEWGDHSARSIGLATSADGNTWVKYANNPVITAASVGSWVVNSVDPWGIIKIGNTYYLWINNVSENPRQSGLATSTDLINWTMDPHNPIFTDNRYCSAPIKYKNKYYLFMPNSQRIELYRDSDPRFLPSSREYLGVVYESSPGTWDSAYLDTPSFITLDITRSTFRNNKIEMYLSNNNDMNSSNWGQGYSSKYISFLDYF